jgi:uncharacterized RDD family membrane protein YckC
MTASDEFLNIDTPENVVFGYEIAGIGSRFLAALVDSFLIAILLILSNLTLLFLLANLITGEEITQGAAWVLALFGLVSFGFLWGYYIFFELLWNGQSPGKRWLGLRVLCTDGTPIGISEAIIRNLIRIVDFLPAYYGVGVVTMFLNQQARRLGDLAAGTLVVYDRGNVTLESLRTQTWAPLQAPTADSAFAHLPLRQLDEEDVALAENFLQRRHQLENESMIASTLAQALLRKMGVDQQALAPDQALALLRAVASPPEVASPTEIS